MQLCLQSNEGETHKRMSIRKPEPVNCVFTAGKSVLSHDKFEEPPVLWTVPADSREQQRAHAELNPICHFLALLEALPFLHVRRISVNHTLLGHSQMGYLRLQHRVHALRLLLHISDTKPDSPISICLFANHGDLSRLHSLNYAA